jgi:hypothetical protein
MATTPLASILRALDRAHTREGFSPLHRLWITPHA